MWVLVCVGGGVGLRWWPNMRGGVAVGAHGRGGRRMTMPERGGVRRYFGGLGLPIRERSVV